MFQKVTLCCEKCGNEFECCPWFEDATCPTCKVSVTRQLIRYGYNAIVEAVVNCKMTLEDALWTIALTVAMHVEELRNELSIGRVREACWDALRAHFGKRLYHALSGGRSI